MTASAERILPWTSEPMVVLVADQVPNQIISPSLNHRTTSTDKSPTEKGKKPTLRDVSDDLFSAGTVGGAERRQMQSGSQTAYDPERGLDNRPGWRLLLGYVILHRFQAWLHHSLALLPSPSISQWGTSVFL